MQLPVISDSVAAPWYSAGLRFECTGCGNCCTGGPGYVWISPVEIERLADYLKLSVEEVIERYCRAEGEGMSLKEVRTPADQYDCIFLKEVPGESVDDGRVVYTKRICTIYPVRPLQCRTWPFWEGNLSSRRAWRRAAARCPGIGQGDLHSARRIDHLRTSCDWPDDAG